jgi:ADP-ribosyl-[dinitrogen reductase] hydrolase
VREIKHWRPKALVSAILDEELQSLAIQNVGAFATRAGLWWFRVPIPDGKEPDERFWQAWPKAAPTLLDLLRRGEKVVVHSANGYGRSSLVAACLLMEMGSQPDAALAAVRAAQPSAIAKPFQESFVRSYLPRFPEHTRMRS